MKIDRRGFLGLGLASATLGGCATGPRYPRPLRPISRLGGEIRHLVVLMMENRSYDQMLGGLPGPEYAGPPPGAKVSYTWSSMSRSVTGRRATRSIQTLRTAS
jgi:phospholipase C